ncbi:peroxisomal membrane protein 4 [Stylonychia lemnae]|uniref:Peroxisomal membrane protein 4 n=1 Tax=Stylonychia lemnae TaxID=5949 RepID=A0A077ZRS2_STYLE|nr:peroxisomal membrane protein 4 [Stylonychia lemnae]|eukprot:CDW72618.1 peroxisomal membrane protein 4 [Stylonychia lemnae]
MVELQQTLGLPPSNGPCPHNSCWISAIRGLRNGLYYGGKVRFAHAIVMAILFQQGTVLDKLKSAIKLAWQHGKNLGSFVFIYKLVQCALQQLFNQKNPVFSFVAGIIGAYFVWRDRNSINQQICFYLLSRILEGTAKRLQKSGHLPEMKAFGYVSMICWGVVMFLFEEDKSVLQNSLQSSMTFLYKDSDQVNGWRDFVPIYIP